MKIDELIQELEQVQEEHGNLEVMSKYKSSYTTVSKVEHGEAFPNKEYIGLI